MNNNQTDDTPKLLRISEIADFFGVSAKAMRLYEQKGIIKPHKIDPETGYRYYSADQVKQLNSLVELQELGFTLNEIKKIMDGGIKTEKLKEALEEKRAEWERHAADVQRKIEAIENIEDRIARKLGQKEISEMTEEERAWYLVNVVAIEELKGNKTLSEAIWL